MLSRGPLALVMSGVASKSPRWLPRLGAGAATGSGPRIPGPTTGGSNAIAAIINA